MIVNGPEHGGGPILTFLRVLQVAILDEYDKQTNGLMVTTTKKTKNRERLCAHSPSRISQTGERNRKKQQKYKKGTGHI